MRTWVKRTLAGAGVVGALAATVLVGGMVASEARIHAREDPPLRNVQISSDVGAVERGRHLSRVYGCSGCHGAALTGEVFFDEPFVGRLYATNLTQVMAQYSDAQLARAIQGGVRADGTALWAMPSESWVSVTDSEMADLLAYLRSHAPAGAPTPKASFGPLGRLGVLTGEFKPTSVYVTEAKAKPAFDAGPGFARGRHIAATVCSECHSSDLMGGDGTPDLVIAAAYDPARFARLMRTGIGADGKEHGLMTEVARSRFVHLSDQDVADLHAYLTVRAEQTP